MVLIDFTRLCRTPRGCTTEGVVRAALRGALFGAAVGTLVDAAIPSKAARNADERAAESRHFSMTLGVRF